MKNKFQQYHSMFQHYINSKETCYDTSRCVYVSVANYIIPQQLLCFETLLQKFHPSFMDVIMF
jgi:hypothetical protein